MLASRQPTVASVRRDAWVEIDLGAIEHNIKTVRSWLAPHTKVMAVVKSDAYGHGAPAVSEVLTASGADFLGVASLDEGCQLRAQGISAPILLLSPCPSWVMATALDADLQLTITSLSEVEAIAEAAKKAKRIAKIHLKVDTGMHRLGVRPDKALAVLHAVAALNELKLCGLFSHLSKADDEAATLAQDNLFRNVIVEAKRHGYEPEFIHLASSDAIKRFPQTHHNMVRPGLVLYGLESTTVSDVVKPAMSVRGRIIHLAELKPGESAGYSLTWQADRPSRIATIPIGYADGIDRGLSNNMEGILHGRRVKQVGLISMDQMMFDITDVPQAQSGDVLTLLGCDSAFASAPAGHHDHTLYLAAWANRLGTITYELACRLRARMPRIYTRHTPGAAHAKA